MSYVGYREDCCIDGDDLSSGYVRNNMRNVDTEQFASGEVCWYLNNGTGSVDPVWEQIPIRCSVH